MTDARPSISRARRLAAAALAAGLVLGLGACGGDDDDEDAADLEETSPEENSPAGTTGGDATMTLTESQFQDVSVAAGGTIEVTNDSGVPHTMTADDGAFDEELPDGETTPVAAPSEPGDYGFHCEIHPSMTATLTVQ